jgi:signal transduction histidine kinase
MALMTYLELSSTSLDHPEKMAEYIAREQEITNIITSQIRLTGDFEDMGLNPPLWQNIHKVIRCAAADIPMRNIQIIDLCTDIELFADPLLTKVFYHLIDNAARYGGERLSRISFSFHESGDSGVLIYEDDGAGIPEEDKKFLFTRGFGKKTGLGLFLSREVLSTTGIRITENGVTGKGARFEITIPKRNYRSCE